GGGVMGRLGRAAWWSDLEHADLCIGWLFGACACWGGWGALHSGGRGWAGICWSWRADGGAFCCGLVLGFGEAGVPQGGPGGVALGWSLWGCGASGPAG